MNVGQLKAAIAGYMHRDPGTFVHGENDLLLMAMNMARKSVERRVNFELSQTEAKVDNVDYQDGASLSSAVLTSSGASVAVKTIDRAFLQFSNGSGTFPINVITRDAHMNEVQRHFDRRRSVNPKEEYEGLLHRVNFALVRHGDTIYVTPSDLDALGASTFTVFMDIVRWLNDYTADTDSDFITEHCFDLMLLRSVYYLNFFIKEDERVQISAAAMDEAWKSVETWNAHLIMNSAEDAALE